MRRWLPLLALVGCSRGGAPVDRCATMLTKLAALDSFGSHGVVYGDDAVQWGVACRDFTEDDFRCVEGAAGDIDARLCRHVWTVASDAADHAGWKPEGPPPSAAALRSIADAACACADVTCLVGVGDRMRGELAAISTQGQPADPDATAQAQRLVGCEDAIRGR